MPSASAYLPTLLQWILPPLGLLATTQHLALLWRGRARSAVQKPDVRWRWVRILPGWLKYLAGLVLFTSTQWIGREFGHFFDNWRLVGILLDGALGLVAFVFMMVGLLDGVKAPGESVPKDGGAQNVGILLRAIVGILVLMLIISATIGGAWSKLDQASIEQVSQIALQARRNIDSAVLGIGSALLALLACLAFATPVDLGLERDGKKAETTSGCFIYLVGGIGTYLFLQNNIFDVPSAKEVAPVYLDGIAIGNELLAADAMSSILLIAALCVLSLPLFTYAIDRGRMARHRYWLPLLVCWALVACFLYSFAAQPDYAGSQNVVATNQWVLGYSVGSFLALVLLPLNERAVVFLATRSSKEGIVGWLAGGGIFWSAIVLLMLISWQLDEPRVLDLTALPIVGFMVTGTIRRLA